MSRKNQKLDVRSLIDFEKYPALKDLTNEELIAFFWYQGNLSWKLDSAQKELYDFFHKNKETITVASVSRQTGKSFLATITAFEYCLKNENVQVKYAAGDAKAALKAIRANIINLCAEAPKELRPSYDRQLGCWKFKNNSLLYLEGLDSGKADSLRGTPANLIIVDEAAFVNDLKYAVYSVLMPMTMTTRGKILIISTPPKSKGHEFVDFVKDSEYTNSFFLLDAYTYIDKVKNDIPYFRDRFTLDQLEKLKKTTPKNTFNKEYLCMFETNTDDAVIPEFLDVKKDIIKEWEKPKSLNAYVAMDLGVKDLSAVVFGYYDFLAGKLIIEDELEIDGKKMNTDYLGKNIKRIESELWGELIDNLFMEEPKRVCDINEQIARIDLYRLYNLKFTSSPKDDKEAGINMLRVLIQNEKIIINPKCKRLIFHLENAVWNKSRSSFERSSVAGHYDFVDAMVYLIRAVKWNKNPYKNDGSVPNANTMFSHRMQTEKSDVKIIKKMFKPRIKRF
jgi:hypothetical protein